MTCSKCGADVGADAAFCGQCGAALGSSTRLERPPPSIEAQAERAVALPSSVGTVPGAPISAAVRSPDVPSPPDPAFPAPPPAVAPLMSAAARAAAKAPRAPGTVIDQKYVIDRILGEGGMGLVYLARDVHTGMPVVLKAIRGELAHRADIRERALAEGRALARIDHPNVVRLNAVVVDGQQLWLVMQYIDGESLEDAIEHYRERGERMPIAEALRVFRQIAAGIGAAHREGVIHRDLKPANILIRAKDGVAKVGDFGIAKAEEDALAGRGQTMGIIGSIWYMSPEQVIGRRDLDKRVDVYALGIVLYQMLVGEVPFDADNDYDIMRMQADMPVPSVSALRADAPPPLDQVIRKACAKNRDDRFANCDELVEALDAAVMPAPPPPRETIEEPLPPPPAAHEPPRAVARSAASTVTAIVGIGALAVASVGAFFTWGRRLTGERHHRTPTALTGTRPQASASAAGVTPDPLDALTGNWVSENGRDFDAIRVGPSIEFRVHDSAQFVPQDYQTGEARFVLSPIEGDPKTFGLEDRIRPAPPVGRYFDSSRSRTTCYEVWTSAEDRALRATYDGSRISADVVKIEPTIANFLVEGSKVIGCRGLRTLHAERIVITLKRP